MKAAGCVLFVVVALAAVCCDKNNGSTVTPTPTTLAGTWKATRAEFVNATNSSQRVEAVSQGVTIVLALDAGGSFTQQTTQPGHATESMTGTYSASSDVLTLKPAGVSWNIQFDMTLGGSTLTLNGGHVQFDVNNDDQDEETILNMTLARQ